MATKPVDLTEFEVLYEKPGYTVLVDKKTGNKGLKIHEKCFTEIIRQPKYRILCREFVADGSKGDGEKFIQTQEVFCQITEVTETSKKVPVIKFVTIPDGHPGLLIKDQMVITQHVPKSK